MKINKIPIYSLITIFILMMGWKTQAQNHTLKGYIYDARNHEPLAEATVQLNNKQTSTHTDKNGFFKLIVTQSIGEIEVSLMGYKTKRVQYNIAKQPLSIELTVNNQLLNAVVIKAFSQQKSIKNTAGSVAYLSKSKLKEGSGTSMQMALNQVPGVRMDQSNLGDSRISIRGNGVRSPWGMRNIKVYVNGIPLTETDGTTRIEALDIPALGSAQIIKGPASSIYGAGTGGIIKFQLERSTVQTQGLTASMVSGAYGLQREALIYKGNSEKFNAYVSYGQQYYSGYREHSSDRRKFLTGNFQFFPSNKRSITLLVSRTNQRTQIPGALTRTQVTENRKQAAAANVEKKAGRIQTWTRLGVGQKYEFNPHLSNTTSIFTYFYDLHHPLVFGIIRNFYQSYGGRTVFNYDPQFNSFPTTFTFGGEYNQGRTKGSIYVNDHGKEGAMFSNTDYKNTMFTLFLQAQTQLGSKTTLTAGLSYNGMTYNVTDYLTPEDGGVKKFNPQASPRIALSHNFGSWLSLHGSVSYGFSPPTTNQITNANQSINKDLQAVKGLNYEIDAKGYLLDQKLSYSLSLYDMEMKGELIAQTISPGITVYHNSGKTSHKGVELGLSYQAIKQPENSFFTKFNPFLALTYADFTVKEYTVLDNQNQVVANYAGNELIGVAPWTINTGFSFSTQPGIYGNANYYFSDKYALNDANTDYNKAYAVVNVKLGYKTQFGKHVKLNLFAGIKNLTNVHYSSFTALNATARNGMSPAYFNPSPGKNGYFGINLNYHF